MTYKQDVKLLKKLFKKSLAEEDTVSGKEYVYIFFDLDALGDDIFEGYFENDNDWLPIKEKIEELTLAPIQIGECYDTNAAYYIVERVMYDEEEGWYEV